MKATIQACRRLLSSPTKRNRQKLRRALIDQEWEDAALLEQRSAVLRAPVEYFDGVAVVRVPEDSEIELTDRGAWVTVQFWIPRSQLKKVTVCCIK